MWASTRAAVPSTVAGGIAVAPRLSAGGMAPPDEPGGAKRLGREAGGAGLARGEHAPQEGSAAGGGVRGAGRRGAGAAPGRGADELRGGAGEPALVRPLREPLAGAPHERVGVGRRDAE